MNVKAKLPTAVQAGIRPEIYGKLAQNPQCARLGTECTEPCEQVINGEYPVELDHIVAKSRGGLNSIDNLQWLCKCENRKKHARPDVQYAGDLYFDQPIDVEKLRPHQAMLGYKLAVQDYKELFISPEKIFARFMLLAWLVGAGKTVGALAILFGINHARKSLGGGSARRIKRVLWLVHQKSLVSSIAKEVETELAEHRIAEYSPSVIKVTDPAKWDYRADVIVACPQALWDSKVNSLDDTRRAEILSSFDAIIVDEAQFGIDHYLHLAKLAPLAFKFAVTSTPMDGTGTLFCDIDNGEYRNHFVLYSHFGYEEGKRMGIYKHLAPLDEGLRDGLYVPERGGDAIIRSGEILRQEKDTSISNNLVRDVALIRSAMAQAESNDQVNNYDDHIMVRAASISHAQSLVKGLEYTGQVFGVWSGSKGPLLGDDKSPWMRAKANKGRIPKDGKRVVITVDIGQFGINNRYCGIIVWVAPNRSMIEIVQRIGRAIRRGPGQTDASVRLYWNAADKSFPESLDDAIEYIRDMPGRMVSFRSMYDLIDDATPIDIPPYASRLKPEHRVAIAAKMGDSLLDGLTHEDAAHEAVTFLGDALTWSDEYSSKARYFAESLTTTDGRDKSMQMPQSLEGSAFVVEEDPIDEYSINSLVAAIKSALIRPKLTPNLREIMVSRIESGDELTIVDATNELIDINRTARKLDQISSYTPRQIVGGKGAGESPPSGNFVSMMLKDYAGVFPGGRNSASGPIVRSLNLAVADHFGLANFKRDTYQKFEKQLADAMMRENERRLILQRAGIYLIRDNPESLPHLATLYADQVRQAQHAKDDKGYRHAA